MTNYKLGSEITSGGEGTIYEVVSHPDLVAKIFKDPQKHKSFKGNIPFLKKLPNEFIVPIELIESPSSPSGTPVLGFTMKKLDPKYRPISGVKYTTSGVTATKKIELFNLIRKGIEKAHSLNIQIGDINGENLFYHNDIRFLDTTSYQTPYERLSNYFLQPEITDYCLNHLGLTNESDYFGFASLTYELLTGCHPYKGTYSGINGSNEAKLKERVIRRLSILGNHIGLKVPGCHQPIADKWLNDQYLAIFEKGDRFLLSFDKKITIQQKPQVVDIGDVVTKTLFFGSIDRFMYNDNYVIINDSSFQIQGKGWYTTEFVSKKVDYWDKGNRYNINQNGEIEINGIPNKNISAANSRFHYSRGTLLLLDDEYLTRVSLSNFSFTRVKTFVGSFFFTNNGVRQYLGGKSHLQLPINGMLNTVTFKYNILDFHQFGEFLCIKYKESNGIKYGYLKADNNSTIIKETSELLFSCIREDGLVFEPQDGKIGILRKEDFQEIGSLSCPKINENSALYMTKGGILVKNQNEVFLLNKN